MGGLFTYGISETKFKYCHWSKPLTKGRENSKYDRQYMCTQMTNYRIIRWGSLSHLSSNFPRTTSHASSTLDLPHIIHGSRQQTANPPDPFDMPHLPGLMTSQCNSKTTQCNACYSNVMIAPTATWRFFHQRHQMAYTTWIHPILWLLY
jgi:hypothetical protein